MLRKKGGDPNAVIHSAGRIAHDNNKQSVDKELGRRFSQTPGFLELGGPWPER